MIEVTMWLRAYPETIETWKIDPLDRVNDSDIDEAIHAFCVWNGIRYTPDDIERHMQYSVNYAA